MTSFDLRQWWFDLGKEGQEHILDLLSDSELKEKRKVGLSNEDILLIYNVSKNKKQTVEDYTDFDFSYGFVN